MPDQARLTAMRRLISLVIPVLAACATTGIADERPVQSAPVPLDTSDPSRTEVGRLRFLGGLHLTSSDPRFGGYSGLRWSRGRLFAVSDTGSWASFVPVERQDRLVALRAARLGDLHGLRGERLAGKADTDAEALAIDENGGWLVGFERNHRIWRYRSLAGHARLSKLDPIGILGPLSDNSGVEALAGSPAGLLVCAEREPGRAANCQRVKGGRTTPVMAEAPPPLDGLGGVPTDAGNTRKGKSYVLFRSYSEADGPGAAIVEMSPRGVSDTVAVFRPPLIVDNMEGLAIREKGGRTFVYLISDDNFSPLQRTLLLKFELLSSPPPIAAGDGGQTP